VQTKLVVWKLVCIFASENKKKPCTIRRYRAILISIVIRCYNEFAEEAVDVSEVTAVPGKLAATGAVVFLTLSLFS